MARIVRIAGVKNRIAYYKSPHKIGASIIIQSADEITVGGDIVITGALGCGAITNEGGAIFNETGAAVDFRVESNDNTHMFFVDAGNNKIGIGTAAPNAPLEVKGAKPGIVGGHQSGMFHVTGSGTAEFSNSVITGHNSFNGNTQLWYLGSMSSSDNKIGFLNRQNAPIHFYTNNTFRMTVDALGNIGIGLTTVDPNYKLIIRRTANINLGIGLQSSELAIAAFNDALSANIPMRFYASEFNLLNGAVGINTTTPVSKLSINGGLHVGGDSDAGDNNLLVDGKISSGTLVLSDAGPTYNLDVSGINTVFVDTSSNDVTIGGFVGGVNGQEVRVVVIDDTNDTILEHEKGTGNQDIHLHAGNDETLDGHLGGWNLVCYNATGFYDESHSKHV